MKKSLFYSLILLFFASCDKEGLITSNMIVGSYVGKWQITAFNGEYKEYNDTIDATIVGDSLYFYSNSHTFTLKGINANGDIHLNGEKSVSKYIGYGVYKDGKLNITAKMYVGNTFASDWVFDGSKQTK